ncbi:hypothetical protein ACYATP_07960 [Lactobacillaceae bacterium Melli_B4]
MIQWYIKPFSELTLTENQTIQNFMDVNGNNPVDRKAYHLWANDDDQMIAYVRIYELDGEMVFDRFRLNDQINTESFVYRILEVGSRFFECETVKVATPFEDSLLAVYEQVGFEEHDGWLMMPLYH